MKNAAQPNARPTRAARGPHAAVGRYRDKMRRQGMRLVQFWAPDVGAPGFAEECRRQSRLVASDRAHEKEILDEIEALSADLALGSAPDFVMPGEKKK